VAAIVDTAAVAVVSHLATKKYLLAKTKARVLTDLLQAVVDAVHHDMLTKEELGKIAGLVKRLVE